MGSHRKQSARVALILLLGGAIVAAAVIILGERQEEQMRLVSEKLRGRQALTPTLRLPDPRELASLPASIMLNHPLNYPNGVLTYNAQRFGENRHLGDDYNGIGGMDSDLGDPVYAIAPGLVVLAEDFSGGWGKVVIVVHALPEPGGGRRYIQSMSAHLLEITVEPGQKVAAGEIIGSVGSADGAYPAHLHFEMRDFTNPFIGPGYRPLPAPGWLDPVEMFEANQPEDPALQFLPIVQAQEP